MICNACDLSPDQKATLETLLGHRVQDGEAISVRTFDTTVVSNERKLEIANELRKYFAEVDASRKSVSDQEAEDIITEALRSVRPAIVPIVRILDNAILVRAHAGGQRATASAALRLRTRSCCPRTPAIPALDRHELRPSKQQVSATRRRRWFHPTHQRPARYRVPRLQHLPESRNPDTC